MKIIENRNKFFATSLAVLLLGFTVILFNQFTGKEAFNYGVGFYGGLSYNVVSATVSSEMRNDALKAVGIACIAILIYISIRFRDVRTGASAIIALIHDTLFVIIVYGVLRIPLNNSFIATILTILGYSINTTIIIFDRLRENRRITQGADNGELINKSISQTLSRCINTTATTLIIITVLYFMGVSAVKEFALPIIIGVICGTYTSICFAGSILYILSTKSSI